MSTLFRRRRGDGFIPLAVDSDGLIGKRLFTALVLMALITTMMTGPLLSVHGATAFNWCI